MAMKIQWDEDKASDFLVEAADASPSPLLS